MASLKSIRRFELPFFARPWIAGVIALVLLLIGLGLAVVNERYSTTEQARRATVQAQILAGSVSAALAFDDRATAQEFVGALHADHDIESVAIYDSDGQLVGGFGTHPAHLSKAAAAAKPRIEDGRLTVSVPVEQGALRLGTVSLRTVIEPWSRRATRYIGISIILLLAALLIAVLGSSYSAASNAYRDLQRESEAREVAEAALRQAQKMEAMGQLTGGVAHDFNNLLMAASSGVELLERTQDPARRARLLSGVRDALDRGAKLTQQLLAFARRTPVKPEVIDVGARLQGIRDLLDRSLREDVRVEFHVHPDVWPIEVDPAQFDIAVVNIAVNARDSMPHGGVVEIEADNVAGGLAGEDAVRVSIIDHGSGMAQEVIEKAFEPFFTTKGVGRGTGLGLSQVYGFARAAGGDATIDSNVGEGTRVSLLLPRCLQPVHVETARRPAPAPEVSGSNLLVVEDDDRVAESLQQMLSELGCKVTRAADASEGLAKFARAAPDAVISDMVMPGERSGLDLAREIRRRRADVPVLLMTGYSTAASEARSEGYTLLEKPFSMDQLAAALGQVFGGIEAVAR